MDATASRAGENDDDDKKQGAAPAKKVSLLGLFRYADRLDLLLMAVGTVGALANGVAEPLMTILFGNVIDSFGDSTSQDIVRSVRKVSACTEELSSARSRFTNSPIYLSRLKHH